MTVGSTGYGKYRPIAELGHGGMAEVFLAVSSGPAGFNKLVVVKQIRPQFAEDPDFLTMFLDEARLAARLNHPNVVQTNEVGQDESGRYFICMEYLEGQPLNRIINRLGQSGAISIGMQCRVLVDALAGLHYAHELNDFDGSPLEVVHRDVTPHNVFVTYTGQAKVVDFGIAKAMSSSAETRTGVLKGKVAYMAPEQAMGEKVDRRADVFGMGMVLWEVLAGRRLYKGVTDVAILHKIVNADIPRPSTQRPDIPAAVEEVCMKALARDVENRYQTAADFATALEEALDASGDRSTLRELGKILDKHFEADRARVRALVEAELSGQRNSAELPAFDPRFTGSAPRTMPQLDVESTSGPRQGMTGAGTRGTGTRNTGAGTMGSQGGRGTGTRSGLSQAQALTPQEAATVVHGTPVSRAGPSSLTVNMASAPPPELEPPAGKGKLIAVAAAIAVAAGVATVFLLSRGGGAAADTKPGGSAAVAASAPVAPGTRNLRIESIPAGATVTEGSRTIGQTPLTVPLDPKLGPRHLVVALEGFVPYAVEQGPSAEDVRIVVPLATAAVAPQPPVTATATGTASASAAAGKPGPGPTRPAGGGQGAAPKPTGVPLDINMAR